MKISKNKKPPSITLTALPGIPLVRPGDNLPEIIVKSLESTKMILQDNDILVIAQKVVSKSEARYVNISDIQPSKKSYLLAKSSLKDPRLVELILRESKKIVRHRKGVIVTENLQGVTMANSGIDHSNVEKDGNSEQVLLLPKNPDKSAQIIREELFQRTKVNVAVIINDSLGRAWRNGTIGTALGVSGLPSLLDFRGVPDLFGKSLNVSEEAIADEFSSAASILQGQAAEGKPIVLIRGFSTSSRPTKASSLIRKKEKDLFQ